MRNFFLILIVVGLLAYFVWPTPYETYAAGEGPYTRQVPDTPTRVNRFTGDIERQVGEDTWEHIGDKRRALSFQAPADQSSARTPSPQQSHRHNQEVVDQQRQSIESTQRAVDAATQQ